MGRHGRRWHRGLDRRSRERVRVLVYLVMLHMQKWPELRDFPRAAKGMPHLQSKDGSYATSVSGLEPGT